MSAFVDPVPIDPRGLPPSGTVTFAFTDIEGSTQRWDRDRAAMADAVRRHDVLVRAAIVDNHGYVFKTIGDAFCAAFWRAEDAVAAMLVAQRALAGEDFSAINGIRVRAAVHTGIADERDGDYFGPVVNRVARLLSIGHGGQILVSGVSRDLVQGLLPPQTSLRDLGEHRLKDLSQREAVFQLVAPDLSAEHPALRSVDAHPNNLPAFLTAFFGREREIAEISALLGAHRLVTLVGSGGIGKTRTSLQVAANMLDGSGDGVWFVELAPLTNGDYITGAVARELGIRLPPSDEPLEDLARALATKRMLLVFDNCEHLIDATARIVATILRSCPNVTILATSRQALGIAGEHTYRLPTLAVPDCSDLKPLTANDAAQSPAVALFVERACAIDKRFELTDANAAMVADICRRLDGIALAIELAAARVKLLSPRQLRDRLDERFRVLTGGNRDVLPRQQTLRALIDWSHDLLDERERVLFRRLGIFVNGFTLEGTVAIAGGDDLDEFDVVDVLGSLVDKSLVLAEPDGDELRYRLLESTRAYALERLRDGGDFETFARRRATFFEAFAGDSTTFDVDVFKRVIAIETELENVREVLRWALEEGHDVHLGARLAVALGRFWSTKLPREGQRWFDLAHAQLPDDVDPVLAADLAYAIAGMIPHGSFERMKATELALEKSREANVPRLLARALCGYGEQLSPLGRIDESDAAFREALEHAQAFGGKWEAARALAGLSTAAIDRHDVVEGRKFGLQSIALFESLGAIDGVAYVCVTLGQAEFIAGNTERAIELTQRARAGHGELQNNRSSACAALYLAVFALTKNDVEEARFHGRDALELLRTDRHPLFLTTAITHLAHVATLSGDARRGAMLLGYAKAASLNITHTRGYAEEGCYAEHLRLLTEALGADELARCMAKGALLSEDGALEEALAV